MIHILDNRLLLVLQIILVSFFVMIFFGGEKVAAISFDSSPHGTSGIQDAYVPQYILDLMLEGNPSNSGCAGGSDEAAQGQWISVAGDSSNVVISTDTTSVALQLNFAVLICNEGKSGGVVSTMRTRSSFGITQPPSTSTPGATITGMQQYNPFLPNFGVSGRDVNYGVGGTLEWHLESLPFTFNFNREPNNPFEFINIAIRTVSINTRTVAPPYECVGGWGAIPSSNRDFYTCNGLYGVTSNYPIVVLNSYEHTADLNVLSNTGGSLPQSSGCSVVAPGSNFRLSSRVYNNGGPGVAYNHRTSTVSGNGSLTSFNSPHLAYITNSGGGSLQSGVDSVLWNTADNPALPSGGSRLNHSTFRLSPSTPSGTRIYFRAAFSPTSTLNSGTGYSPQRCLVAQSGPTDVCNNIPGVQTSVPNGYSESGGVCSFLRPVCTVQNLSVPAGSSQSFTVAIRNRATTNGGFTMNVSSVTYAGLGVGTTTSLDSQNITAGSTENYDTNTIGPITADGALSWSIEYSTGVETVTTNLGNCINVTITTLNPICTAPNVTVLFGDPITIQLTVENPNGVTMDVTDVTYSINTTPVINGAAARVPPPGPPNTIAASGTALYRDLVPGPIDAGVYTITWDVDTQYGDCDPSSDFEADLTILFQPYARFFGNDVFAGGGVANSSGICTPVDPAAAALGYVNYVNPTLPAVPADFPGNFQGTGVQLAVFALGIIDGVQPQAVQTNLSPRSLAFGNVLNSGSNPFGGGFGSAACSYDYAADVGGSSAPSTDVSTLASGSYMLGSGPTSLTTLSTGASGIPNGRDITIYVDGNVRITGNSFGFANTNWSTVDQIPSLYIIATEDVYIDAGVSTIDAVIVAQQAGGEIYTCAGTGAELDLLPLTSVSRPFLVTQCTTNLTVNGAFISEQVHLLRTLGHILDGAPGEGSAATQAETFIYSPEIYLNPNVNLEPRSDGTGIDSIISLPPTL